MLEPREVAGFLDRLLKPEYVFRPLQLLRRASRFQKPRTGDFRVLELPWGLSVRAGIHDAIGLTIWRLGVYELVVSEALWRLIDPGESVADIGANLGHMSSLMAFRTGKGGTVSSFEPHPVIYEALQGNALLWKDSSLGLGQVRIFQLALGRKAGQCDLLLPRNFSENSGTAFLDHHENKRDESLIAISVPVERMDHLFDDASLIPRVIKVDVEGGEADVFEGAGELLTQRRIRDIVFEDHGTYPTRAMDLLAKNGYRLFRLRRSFWGPVLDAPDSPGDAQPWEPANYLATSDWVRATARFKAKGWNSLR